MMGRASDIQIEQNNYKEGLVTLVKLFWYLRDFSIMLINNIVLLGMLIFIFMFEIFSFFAVCYRDRCNDLTHKLHGEFCMHHMLAPH